MAAFAGSNFLQALGWAVLNSLWQMALLWVAYQLITSIIKSISSTRKSLLASALLMTGFGWFLFSFLSILLTRDAGVAASLVQVEGDQRLNNWLNQTLPVASVVYLVLLFLPLVHYIRNYRYVQAIRRFGLSKADVEWRMFVKKVAAQLGIRKPVYIWVSEFVTSPVTIGYLKPVILVPMAAVNHLSARQMEAVLLHELSHIRRYDYFINLIIKFIQSLLYFNPFVKAFVQIVEREREKSCDEMVMQFEYDPHGYASALLELEKTHHLPKVLAVAAAGKKNDLLYRIESIMGVQKKPVISFNKVAAVFAGLLCIIGLNTLLIMSQPSNDNQSPVFADLSSPLYFFVNDHDQKAADIVRPVPESNNEVIANQAREKEIPVAQKKRAVSRQETEPAEFISTVNVKENNPVMTVSSFKPVIPVLNAAELAQVQQALDASKKVLKEGQWKAVEQKIAEVFTLREKELLKAQLDKELNKKLDLSKWETSLKVAYDKINWEQVNTELDKAISVITLDSLHRVYNKAMNELSLIERELNNQNQQCIPDSEISLESIEQKKQNVQKAINMLRAVRTKKVVHL